MKTGEVTNGFLKVQKGWIEFERTIENERDRKKITEKLNYNHHEEKNPTFL